jgi:hypothetical protein
MFDRYGLTLEQLTGSRMQRLSRIRELLKEARVGDDLRWLTVGAAVETDPHR